MADYRGLSVRLLLEEFRSQSCKREVHVGMLENLTFVCVHTTEWFANKFQVFVGPGLLCTEWRSVSDGSELLKSLMCLVLWQEKRIAFHSDNIFFLCRPSRGEDYIELAQTPARFTCFFLDVDVQLVYFTTF